MSALTFQLPDEIRIEVEQLASREGLTMDEFLVQATADKGSALRTLDLLRQEAATSCEEDWEYVMSRVPARLPLAGDELPEELRHALDGHARQRPA